MKIIFYFLTLIILVSSCSKTEDYLPTNFNYEIKPVEITEDVDLGAYYYNYSDIDWAKNYTNTPVLGEYNSLDQGVMEQQQVWAKEGGIDFFIFNWNGTQEDEELLNSFKSWGSNDVKMVVNYNTAHLGLSNESPLIDGKLTLMLDEFKDMALHYFSQDFYYRTNGRPVVLFSPINLSASRSESIDFNVVIPALREAMNEIGIDLYILGEITSGWLPPQRYSEAIQTLDAISLKDWSTNNYDRSVFFPSYVDQNWQNWTDSTTVWGVDFTPVIFSGFDDKALDPDSPLYNLGGNPQFYVDLCHVAKRNMSESRMVLINSWNNFQFGNTIEPTEEYGTGYLEITKDQFKVHSLKH